MIGYGDENENFVLELTYNYGIKSYEKGNDFIGMAIYSTKVKDNVLKSTLPYKVDAKKSIVTINSPDGQKFDIFDADDSNKNILRRVALATSNLHRTIDYWHNLHGMEVLKKTDKSILLSFGTNQAQLEFVDIGGPVNRAKAFGRIAFSCPSVDLPKIQTNVETKKGKILNRLISLDTPGKARVEVVILADPDGHEICFVCDEGFRELSKMDPEANKMLEKAIAEKSG